MRNLIFCLCLLLALSSCQQESSTSEEEKEANLENAAGGLDAGAGERDPDETVEAPTDQISSDPEEPLPGATSAASGAPTLANPLFNYTLQKGQAGAVKIGMPITELKDRYGENKLREIEHIQEGTSSVAFEVLGERSRSDLRVEQNCTGGSCKVSRITVLNPAFKTPEGIGMGSTFGDLKRSMTINQVTQGEEHFVAISSALKMSFILDLGDIPAERWPKLKVKDIPENVPVTGVLIY